MGACLHASGDVPRGVTPFKLASARNIVNNQVDDLVEQD
jgi:hypothetical protein